MLLRTLYRKHMVCALVKSAVPAFAGECGTTSYNETLPALALLPTFDLAQSLGGLVVLQKPAYN